MRGQYTQFNFVIQNFPMLALSFPPEFILSFFRDFCSPAKLIILVGAFLARPLAFAGNWEPSLFVP